MMHGAPVGQGGPVPVGPHAREPLEVGRPVTAAVIVVPESHRHGRQGGRQHQLALLADQRLAVIVEHLDGGTHAPARDLAGPDRVQGAGTHEAGADVGATAKRRQHDVTRHLFVDPVGRGGRQRRTGRAQRP